jgi:cytochrome P450
VPFLFAVAGSVGFTLGWAIYLLGTQPPDAPAEQTPPEWIVREALRLWPIAWQLARRPATTHEVAGVEVTPRHHVLVSPYVTHRHPAYWSEPERFRPERWEDASAHRAFLPFGWGPHTCAAAALTLELLRDVLAVLLRDYRLSVSPGSGAPFTGPSLAPPRFELALSPKAP